MQWLAPDILLEARGLSTSVCIAGAVLGFLLWCLGWWGHRFWIVLAATVGAGTLALHSASAYEIQPLVAGLLAAVAAGLLALALVRVIAFAACGLTACILIHAIAPAWEAPLICLLIGGLLGLFLFRFWTMLVTSGVGALLIGYSGLSLAERFGKVDAITWATSHPKLLNGACAGVALLGLFIQFFIERCWRSMKRHTRKQAVPVKEASKPLPTSPSRKFSLWGWVHGKEVRRAG